MSTVGTTSALGWDNKFTTTLSSGISASDTTIPLTNLPNASQGFLVIEPDSATAWEEIFYTSKTGSAVICPSVANGRGAGGSSAASHSAGATVRMDSTAEMFEALQDFTAMGAGIVTPDKLATGAASATVAAVETTTSTSYAFLATTTDQVTVNIGANGVALISMSAFLSDSTTAVVFVGVDISGASTVVATDTNAIGLNSINTTGIQCSYTFVKTGLTPGSTTFKLKYKVSTGTGSFGVRTISVVPL